MVPCLCYALSRDPTHNLPVTVQTLLLHQNYPRTSQLFPMERSETYPKSLYHQPIIYVFAAEQLQRGMELLPAHLLTLVLYPLTMNTLANASWLIFRCPQSGCHYDWYKFCYKWRCCNSTSMCSDEPHVEKNIWNMTVWKAQWFFWLDLYLSSLPIMNLCFHVPHVGMIVPRLWSYWPFCWTEWPYLFYSQMIFGIEWQQLASSNSFRLNRKIYMINETQGEFIRENKLGTLNLKEKQLLSEAIMAVIISELSLREEPWE